MSLGKSLIPITFPGGLDQKTPSKLLLPGRFLRLENCVRRKNGELAKRFGFTSLSPQVYGLADIAAGKKIDSFGDDLIMLDGQRLYSYSSANDQWVSKGSCATALVELSQYIRDGNTQSMPDMATLDGISVVVWQDSGASDCRYSVYDDATGAALLYNQQLSASGTKPKVISTRDGFVVAYRDGTNLKAHAISRATPTVLGAANTVGSNVNNSAWDMASYDDYGVLAYANSSTSLVTVSYITQTAVAGSPGTNGLPNPIDLTGMGTGVNALTVVADDTLGRIWLAFHGSAGTVKAAVVSSDFLVKQSVDIETIANIRNITGCLRSSDRKLQLFYEQSAASVKDYLVKRAVVEWSGSGSPTITTAAALHMKSVGLASKAFEHSGNQYVTVSHDSTFQPTYFLTRQDGYILARILGNIAGGHTASSGGLPRVSTDSEGHSVTALQVRNKLTIETGGKVLASNKGLSRVSLDLESANFVGAILGRNYHIAGGSLLAYDGVRVVEHGFYLFPEDLTESVSSGGTLAAADYSYRVIYEWTDAQGQIHRSAPSITRTKTVTANQKISITVPTLRITNRTATDVKIVVYVAANGLATVYYRNAVAANATTDTVTIDVTTESSPTAEILYTTGGVMENIAAPAAKVVHTHKNRLFLGGVETGEIFFSKEHVATEGVGFQDFIRIKVDNDGGPVTALATLDDKLVCFKQDRIYIQFGEGPLDTGAQNDYGPLQRIASDVGTVTPQSVVSTPMGIMFKSDKGIYLLSRSLQVRYVGAGVEDFNSESVTSATVLSDENEVRFTTADSSALVYNYYFDQWSTFSNYASVSACNALGTYLHLTANGTVYRETPNAYSDNGSRYSMAIETSWLSFAGIQGFQRIYEILLLGDLVSHHYTRAKIAYDFESAYNETVYFNTQSGIVSGTAFGDDPLYGDDEVYGQGSDVYQFRIQPARQKCEAMKLRIEDIDTLTAIPGGSFKLVAMTCEVGRKQGANKLPNLRNAS